MNKSKQMAAVKTKGTALEKQVRKLLYNRGYRYRVNVKGLQGTPDIFILKYNVAVFVHGCFWHGHKNCYLGHLPKTNTVFRSKKIRDNQRRDFRNRLQLQMRGYRVVEIWECALKGKRKLESNVLADIVDTFISEKLDYHEISASETKTPA